MNGIDEKRVEKIKGKILYYSKKKLECIRSGNLERARICSKLIELLYNKERDIIEGIERIMIRRKEELEEEKESLTSLLENASLLNKIEIKKEIYKINEELKEDKLREYAREKKNSKVKKKEMLND